MRSRLRRVLATGFCGVAIFAASACGAGKDSGGDQASGGDHTTSANTASGYNGSEPAGGWPQGESGVLDGKMCAILTSKDFHAWHMTTGTPEVTDFPPDAPRVGVTCNYALSDRLNLGLPASPSAAQALYQNMARNRELPAASVKGADKAIAGPEGPDGSYLLLALRGRLYIEISLGSDVNQLSAQEATTAATGMAELVLTRAPKLGL